jgi:hypothetical protein
MRLCRYHAKYNEIMQAEEKKTIRIRCPKCQTNHIFVRQDYEGKRTLRFKCECGNEHSVDLGALTETQKS